MYCELRFKCLVSSLFIGLYEIKNVVTENKSIIPYRIYLGTYYIHVCYDSVCYDSLQEI